jgi:hypothetical protein
MDFNRWQLGLNKKWNTPKACPICEANDWGISESLALFPRVRFADEGDISGHFVYPHFFVTCINCGYTIFFNAKMAGFGRLAQVEMKES